MAAGYKDFTAGAVLTAADLEDYCENQAIMRFASAAARDAALTTVKTEGMYAYLIDVNTLTVYSGSAWSTDGPVHGALLTWAPTVTQSGTVTYTATQATYQRVGRRITATCVLTITGTGTATNLVTVTLPVTAVSAGDGGTIGSGHFVDASAVAKWLAMATQANTGSVVYISLATVAAATDANQRLGTGGVTVALAAGDIISLNLMYEAAADA